MTKKHIKITIEKRNLVAVAQQSFTTLLVERDHIFACSGWLAGGEAAEIRSRRLESGDSPGRRHLICLSRTTINWPRGQVQVRTPVPTLYPCPVSLNVFLD
jgi:hypothetical protein